MRVTATRGGVPAFLRRLFAGLAVRAGALREDTRVTAPPQSQASKFPVISVGQHTAHEEAAYLQGQ